MHPSTSRHCSQAPHRDHSIPHPVLPATRRHLQSLSASSSMSLVSCDMQVGCSQACTGLPVAIAVTRPCCEACRWMRSDEVHTDGDTDQNGLEGMSGPGACVAQGPSPSSECECAGTLLTCWHFRLHTHCSTRGSLAPGTCVYICKDVSSACWAERQTCARCSLSQSGNLVCGLSSAPVAWRASLEMWPCSPRSSMSTPLAKLCSRRRRRF